MPNSPTRFGFCGAAAAHSWRRTLAPGFKSVRPQLPPHRALLWAIRGCFSMRCNPHLINLWLKNSLRIFSLNFWSAWNVTCRVKPLARVAQYFFQEQQNLLSNYGEFVSRSTSILICLFAGLEDILLINSKCSSKKGTTLQTVKVPRSSGK